MDELYEKQPLQIRAARVDDLAEASHQGRNGIPNWFLAAYDRGDVIVQAHTIDVKSLEGWVAAGVDDWIICGIAGELYPCRDDIFQKTYRPVAPQHPFETTIRIGGETWDYVQRQLYELAVLAEAVSPGSASAFGAGAGGSYSMSTAIREVSVEQFRKELLEFCDGIGKEKGYADGGMVTAPGKPASSAD